MARAWIFICFLLLVPAQDLVSGKKYPGFTRLTVSPGSSVAFSSPGYEQEKYPRNSNCSWEIVAAGAQKIEVVFEDFDVELQSTCSWDWVTIVNDTCHPGNHDVEKICGKLIANHTATYTGNVVCVNFRSDFMVQHKGFKAIAIPVFDQHVSSPTAGINSATVTSSNTVTTSSHKSLINLTANPSPEPSINDIKSSYTHALTSGPNTSGSKSFDTNTSTLNSNRESTAISSSILPSFSMSPSPSSQHLTNSLLSSQQLITSKHSSRSYPTSPSISISTLPKSTIAPSSAQSGSFAQSITTVPLESASLTVPTSTNSGSSSSNHVSTATPKMKQHLSLVIGDTSDIALQAGSEIILSSPKDENGRYPLNQTRTISLWNENRMMVVLSFLEFSIEYQMTCRYDYLKITTGSESPMKLCGYDKPADLHTTDTSITFIFHSDFVVQKHGFKIRISTSDNQSSSDVQHTSQLLSTLQGEMTSSESNLIESKKLFTSSLLSSTSVGNVHSTSTDTIGPKLSKTPLSSHRHSTSNIIISQVTTTTVTTPTSTLTSFTSLQSSTGISRLETEAPTQVTTHTLDQSTVFTVPTGKPEVAYKFATTIGDQQEISLQAGWEIMMSSPQDVNGHYPLNQKLSTTIINNNHLTVQFSFLEFDLEDHSSCSWDYLQITTTSKPLQKLCGTNKPADLSLTDTYIKLEFQSDFFIAFTGFKIKITTEGQQAVNTPHITTSRHTSETLVLSQTMNTPTSFVSSSSSISTTIAGSTASMLASLQPTPVSTVANSASRTSMTSHPVTQHTGSTVNTELPTSTPAVAHKTEVTIGEASVIALQAGSEIMLSSPRDENGLYPLKKTLSIILANPSHLPVTMSFLQFDIEYKQYCGYDYLQITTTSESTLKFCGYNKPADLHTTDANVILIFHSDFVVQKAGFTLLITTEAGDETTNISPMHPTISPTKVSASKPSTSSLVQSTGTETMSGFPWPSIASSVLSSLSAKATPTAVSDDKTSSSAGLLQSTSNNHSALPSTTPVSTSHSTANGVSAIDNTATHSPGSESMDSELTSSIPSRMFPTLSATPFTVTSSSVPSAASVTTSNQSLSSHVSSANSVSMSTASTKTSTANSPSPTSSSSSSSHSTTSIVPTTTNPNTTSENHSVLTTPSTTQSSASSESSATDDNTTTSSTPSLSSTKTITASSTSTKVPSGPASPTRVPSKIVDICDRLIKQTDVSVDDTITVVSPGFLYNTAYPLNVECSLKVTTQDNTEIVMTVEYFDVETETRCGWDYLQLDYGSDRGRMCGTLDRNQDHFTCYSGLPQVIDPITKNRKCLPNSGRTCLLPGARYLGMKFFSDSYESKTGFNITLTSRVAQNNDPNRDEATTQVPGSKLKETPSSDLDTKAHTASTPDPTATAAHTTKQNTNTAGTTAQTNTASQTTKQNTNTAGPAAPTTAIPTTTAQTTVASTTTAQTTAASTTAAPTTAAPTTDASTTDAPTTAALTTVALTTAAPTTAVPTTAPTTAAPTTAAPTTKQHTNTAGTTASATAAPTTQQNQHTTGTPSQTTEPIFITTDSPSSPTFVPKYDVTSACNNGGVALIIDNEHGYIESPGYSNGEDYPPSTECTWKITENKEKTITLIFETFELEPMEGGKCYDKVIVKEMNKNSKPIKTKVLCGDTLPQSITTENDVIITFQSDGTLQFPGFKMRYIQADGNDKVGSVTSCPAGRWLCPGSDVCIPSEWICDREPDCQNHADEDDCDTCDIGEAACDDGTCIASISWCDGHVHCHHGEDERHCVSKTPDSTVTVQSGEDIHPLCYTEHLYRHSNEICNMIGYRMSKSLWTSPYSGSGVTMVKEKVTDQKTHTIALTASDKCALEQTTQIRCHGEDCGTKAEEEVHRKKRVVGGSLSDSGRWPWSVALRAGTHVVCGATIIDEQWVVTAAHCVEYMYTNPYVLSVIAGVTDVNDVNRELRYVVEVILHPEYNYIYNADIALLRLNRPLPLNDRIRQICLPWDRREFTSSSRCYVAGWGVYDMKDYYTTVAPRHLRDAKTKVVSDPLCQSVYKNKVKDNMICAGYAGGGIDACRGDSGGGLMCESPSGRWNLAGIISWGEACGSTNKPGVYTRVTSFIDWINSTLPDQDPGTGSVNCTFEDSHWCGYTDASTNTYFWTRVPGVPGHSGGNHLYAAQPNYDPPTGVANASILSPTFPSTSINCLAFSFLFSVNSNITLSVYGISDHHDNSDVDSETLLWRVHSNYPPRQKWQTTEVEVPSGLVQLRFESLNRHNSIFGLGLDSVSVTPGNCAGIQRMRCSFDYQTTCLYSLGSVHDRFVPRLRAESHEDFALQLTGSVDQFGFVANSQLISPELPVAFASFPHCLTFSFKKEVTSSSHLTVSTYVTHGGQLANQKVYWSSVGSSVGVWSTVMVEVIDTGYFNHVVFEVERTTNTADDLFYLDDVTMNDGQCL